MPTFGVSSWIYGDEPLAETFARLAAVGYDHIELKGEPDSLDVTAVNRLRRQTGLSVSSILGWSVLPLRERNLAAADDKRREQAVAYGRANIELAAAVGAGVVTVIPSVAGRTAPSGWNGQAADWQQAAADEWQRAVDSVARLAPVAAARGVTLAVEPINRYESHLLNRVEQALSFVDEVRERVQAGDESVALQLDTFHMQIEEPHPAQAVRRAGDRIAGVHIADSNRRAPGDGHLDFRSLLRALAAVGYEGALIMEPAPPHPDPLVGIQLEQASDYRRRDARQSLERIRAAVETAYE